MVENQKLFANQWVGIAVNELQEYIRRLLLLVVDIEEFPPIQPGTVPPFTPEVVDPPTFSLPTPSFTDGAPERPGMLPVTFEMPEPPSAPPDAPDILFPAAPILGAAPVAPQMPVMADVTVPDSPEYTLPAVPTIDELNLPDAPDIDLSQFTIARPEFDTSDIEQGIGFDYIGTVQQVRAMLGDAPQVAGLVAKIEEMLVGGTGLEPNAERAMYERSIARDDLASRQAVDEAMLQWSSRGFSLPGASVNATLARIQMENRQARQNHNREVYIRAHEVAVENLRFAVQQGIAYQGMLFENYLRFYDAARQIADGAFNVVQLMVNARIEMFKTELLVFQADIERFKAELQAELSKLEEYRIRLEGERVRAELSRLKVEVYQAQLQGVLAVVQIFRTQVDAANAQVQMNLSKVEQYKALLDGNRLRLDMDKLRYDIYGTAVQAEATKVGVFEAQTRAFGELVRAYTAEVQGESARVGAINDANKARADIYGSEIRAWATAIGADVERMNGAVNAFRGQVELFGAQVQQNSAFASVHMRQIDQIIQQSQIDNGALLKRADQQIAQIQHASTIGSTGLLGAANAFAQLAASAMSAISASASIGDSSSYGLSHSASYEGGPA
jgi:hypothetical protein